MSVWAASSTSISGFAAPVLNLFRQLYLTQYLLELLLWSICYTVILAVAPAASFSLIESSSCSIYFESCLYRAVSPATSEAPVPRVLYLARSSSYSQYLKSCQLRAVSPVSSLASSPRVLDLSESSSCSQYLKICQLRAVSPVSSLASTPRVLDLSGSSSCSQYLKSCVSSVKFKLHLISWGVWRPASSWAVGETW